LLESSDCAYICTRFSALGGLAQLARALAWHARGHRFESGILHKLKGRSSPSGPFAFLCGLLADSLLLHIFHFHQHCVGVSGIVGRACLLGWGTGREIVFCCFQLLKVRDLRLYSEFYFWRIVLKINDLFAGARFFIKKIKQIICF